MTDASILTAMAHPLRRRILDVLEVHGPSTASMLADRTGQAVGNISHHAKILAEAGLIEEAPELARDRRERWWRRAPGPISWSSSTGEHDAATEAVGLAASALNLDRQVAYARQARTTGLTERPEWVDSAFSTDSWLHLTPDELVAYAAEINAIVVRWATREIPDDGREREPVFTFVHGFPATP
ncbi:MAG TPA: helix-turn-helix domain-containing protein [Micromonosporaceae bacterium]|jgi:DNA-binding transcriptional ArsR family regulator